MESEDPPPLAGPSRWHAALLSLAVAALILCVDGYEGFNSDHTQYLLPAFRAVDAEFAQGDWLVDKAVFYHPTFSFVTTQALRLGQLGWGLFAWHFLTLVGLGAAMVLGYFLFAKPRGLLELGALATLPFLLIGPDTGWGGYHLFQPYAIPIYAGTALAMACLVCLLKRRLLASLALLLATFVIHFALGAIFLVAIAPVALSLYGRDLKALRKPKNVALIVAGLCVMVPLALKVVAFDRLGDPENYKILFYGRSAHHFAAQLYPPWFHAQSLFVLCVNAFLVWRLRDNDLKRGSLVFLCTAAVLFVLSSVFLVGIYQPLFVLLFPFRLFPLFLGLNAILFALHLLDPQATASSRAAIALLALGYLGYRYDMPAGPLLAWPLLGVAIALSLRPPTVRAPLLRGLNAILIAVTLICLGGRLARGHAGFSFQWPTELKELGASIQDHTPVGARLLIPPELEGVRLAARRAVVVNYKCCPIFGTELKEWSTRMHALTGLDPQESPEWILKRPDHVAVWAYRERFLAQSAEVLVKVATDYEADFMLLPAASSACQRILQKTPPLATVGEHCLFRTSAVRAGAR